MTEEIQRWEAAEITLNSYSKFRLGSIMTPDVPSLVITELLADIINYCDLRNDGEDPTDVYFLNFDKLVALAKTMART